MRQAATLPAKIPIRINSVLKRTPFSGLTVDGFGTFRPAVIGLCSIASLR
jgi:hypothetical protein